MIAPALFYFYREVLGERQIAFAGALLGSFAPLVWVQGARGGVMEWLSPSELSD
jgi:hypothetical protein